jgi:hypothetical protein
MSVKRQNMYLSVTTFDNNTDNQIKHSEAKGVDMKWNVKSNVYFITNIFFALTFLIMGD